ncbi:MAG: hypothetical protein ABIK89_00235, partial [Planctomycetota bacterium]
MRQLHNLWIVFLVTIPGAADGAETPDNLALQATPSAQSAASAPKEKYGVLQLLDGKESTHWASRSGYELPHSIRLQWPQPVVLDTVVVDVFAREGANLYAYWKEAEIELDGGEKTGVHFEPEESGWTVLRFAKPVETSSLTLRILAVYKRKTYLGIDEIGVFLDPRRLIEPPRELARPKRRDQLKPERTATNPTVYVNADDLARARRNAEATQWGKEEKASILAQAAPWLEHDESPPTAVSPVRRSLPSPFHMRENLTASGAFTRFTTRSCTRTGRISSSLRCSIPDLSA